MAVLTEPVVNQFKVSYLPFLTWLEKLDCVGTKKNIFVQLRFFN